MCMDVGRGEGGGGKGVRFFAGGSEICCFIVPVPSDIENMIDNPLNPLVGGP